MRQGDHEFQDVVSYIREPVLKTNGGKVGGGTGQDRKTEKLSNLPCFMSTLQDSTFFFLKALSVVGELRNILQRS